MRAGKSILGLSSVLLLFGAAVPASADLMQARFGHTATLLPDGNILVVGGVTADGAFVPAGLSVQASLENRGEVAAGDMFTNLAPLPESRSSHTATLLPTGEVLVTGGVGAAGPRNDARVYSPRLNCWRDLTAGLELMADARANHTATLLKDGRVLVCGGERAAQVANISCDVFTIQIPAPGACAGTDGIASRATVNMQAPRSHHSATLLSDGRVWLAGGMDATGSVNPQIALVTTEMYNPTIGANGVIGAARNLLTARHWHSATLLGNGKVLVVGGFNNRNVRANRGYLDTTELYDPVSDSVVAGARLDRRRIAAHAPVLNPAGSVVILGGLGNITTSFFTAPTGILDVPLSQVTGTVFPAGPTVRINNTGGNLTLRLAQNLTDELGVRHAVTGVIQNGSVLFSTPRVSIGVDGFVEFNDGFENPNGTSGGLAINLAGTPVSCNETGCGVIDRTFAVPITPDPPAGGVGGQYGFFRSVKGVDDSVVALNSSVTIAFPGFINERQSAPLVPGFSAFTTTLTVTGFPAELLGHCLRRYQMTIEAASIVYTGTATITLDGGATAEIALPACTGPGDGQFFTNAQGAVAVRVNNVFFTGLTGEVLNEVEDSDPDVTTETIIGSIIDLDNGTPAVVAGLSVSITYWPDGVTLDNLSLEHGVSTIVIRKMIFGDVLNYDPSLNAWRTSGLGNTPRQQNSATVTASGATRLLGGRNCDALGVCASLVPLRQGTILPALAAFQVVPELLGGPRANHTATQLPNGKILIAGGTNGPNVLRTAELYDPSLDDPTFAPTGSMLVPRDFHSANLLPNGTVLIAGGFTNSSVSTGPTASAELYFPYPGRFVTTSPMPFEADHHTATLLADGSVLVVGGYASNNVYRSEAAIYYSTSGTWGRLPPMHVGAIGNITARALHTATMLQDGRVLIAGGVNASGVLCSAIVFDVNQPQGAGDFWVDAPDIDDPPPCTRTHSHSATLLKSGGVLLAGGNDGFGETNLSTIFNPNGSAVPPVGAWTDTNGTGNRLNEPRFGHTATLLPNGLVAVLGGLSTLGNALNSIESFEVAGSSWQLGGGLLLRRAHHTAIVTPQGFLTVIGGVGDVLGTSILDSQERVHFHPFPDLFTVGSAGLQPTIRQSAITVVRSTTTAAVGEVISRGALAIFNGARFYSGGEAAGGGGAANGNSGHGSPRLAIQSLDGGSGANGQGSSGFILDLSTRIYGPDGATPGGGVNPNWIAVDTAIAVELPILGPIPLPPQGGMMLPVGWFSARAYQNALYSEGRIVQSGPPRPTASPAPVTAAAVTSSNTITWIWSTVLGVDGYNVYSTSTGVQVSSTTDPDGPGNPGVPPLTFNQLNLNPNTSAQISVAGFNLSGDGPLAQSATFFTLSTVPISVGISSVGFNELSLFWDRNNNTLGTIYEVQQSTEASFISVSTPVPAVFNFTSTRTLIVNLQLSTTYYFRVRAYNGAGVPSDFSVVVATQTKAPIAGLVGVPLPAPRGTTEIQWDWIDPGGVTRYNVYNATSGALILSTPTNRFFDVGLATNSMRALQVSAITGAGEGPLSTPSTAFTLAAVPGFVSPPFISLTSGSVVMIWSNNQNPLQTVYEAELTSATDGVAIASVVATGFTAGFGDLPAPALIFGGQVRAINQVGVPSAYLPLGTTSTLANQPINLAIIGTTPNSIAVAWSGNNNTSSATYEVTFSSNDFNSVQTAVSFAAGYNQTSAVITGLLTSTTYSIRVQASNAIGNRNPIFSNIITTAPFNGGVAMGSIGGLINPVGADATIAGTLGNGRFVSLRVPGGTFPSPVFLTISSFNVAGVPGAPCGGANIGVSIVANPPFQPQGPIFFTFAYTDAELAAAGITDVDNATLKRVDDRTGRCVPLLTTADTANRLLTSQLNHLSLFQFAPQATTKRLDDARIFPNPFYASRGQAFITFEDLPPSTHVRLYTIKGELVFRGQANNVGLFTWNAHNRDGRQVASGVYLAVLEIEGESRIRKVVVLR